MKSTRESNDQLQKALQKFQIEVLDADDNAFNKAKVQVLCLHPRLDLPEMDFSKVVVDSRLVEMEEIESSLADDLARENHADNTKLAVVDEDKNEE